MKIIYLSNSIIPSRTANSIQVMKMCQAFALSGQEVILYCPANRKREQGTVNVYDFYGVKECFKIKMISLAITKIHRWIYAYFVLKQIKKDKPDLVYTRFLSGSLLSCLMHYETIFESHKPIANKLGNILFSALNIKLKGVVVISEALKRYYKDNYPKISNQIYLFPDGSDPIQENTVPAKISNDRNKLLVGYAGHLYKGKGMEVVSKLVALCPWAEFHIIGGTNGDINLWKNQLSAYYNIFFHGFLPHNEISSYLLAFDVLVAPYQREVAVYNQNLERLIVDENKNVARWMSPLKIFEYMSAGKAIVASDLPVLKEILKDGENALLVDPDNTDKWALALWKLKDNEWLRERLGRLAKMEYEKKYTWFKRAENILLKTTQK